MIQLFNIYVKTLKVKFIYLLFLGIFFFQVPYAYSEDEYIFILRSKGNPYWNSVAEGIRDTAKEKSVKATVYQGQSESSSEEQLNICQAAIARKPKFIAITAATVSSGIECLKKANSEGIKVAEMDSTIPIEEANNQGLKLSFSVGSDNFLVGKKAGTFAATLLGEQDSKVFILEGAVGTPAGKKRVDGFKEGLNSSAPKAQIVASISADWDRLKAMNITSDIILRFPDLSLIYAANDQMALGAIEALKAQNKLRTVKVIGVDGTKDARHAILAEEMSATVAQLPYLIGKRALELGIDVVAEIPVPQREVTDTPVLTLKLLQSHDTSVLQYVR